MLAAALSAARPSWCLVCLAAILECPLVLECQYEYQLYEEGGLYGWKMYVTILNERRESCLKHQASVRTKIVWHDCCADDQRKELIYDDVTCVILCRICDMVLLLHKDLFCH